MFRIFLLIILLFPKISYADQVLILLVKNLLSALGRQYEPLNFKLEVTDFIILIKITMNLRLFQQRNWYLETTCLLLNFLSMN